MRRQTDKSNDTSNVHGIAAAVLIRILTYLGRYVASVQQDINAAER